jgi:ABC-2 type transport system permease protein
MRLTAYAGAAGAILRRDVTLFLSYRTRLVTQVFTTLFSLTLFYYLSRLVRVEAFESPDDYYAFVVVGLVIVGVLTSALGAAAGAMRQELVAGTFERLVISPFGAVASLVSMMVFPFVMSLVMSSLTLAIAAVVFDLPVTWSTAPLAIPVAALGALSFAPFGIAIAAIVLVFKQAQSIGGFLMAGISIIAGIYFPVSLLPGSIEWMSEVQPFTPSVDLMRHLLVGAELTDSPWLELAKIGGFATVLLPVSIAMLGLAVAIGRKRGTIIEY